MPITYVAAGAASVSDTGALSVTHPAGLSDGDLLVLLIVNKPGLPPTTPRGWSTHDNATATGGAGPDVAGQGMVRTDVYVTVADAALSDTTLDVVVPDSPSIVARMFAYRAADGATWDVSFTSGVQNTGGSTTWGITGAADVHAAPGDVVLVGSGSNGNAYSYSGETLSAAGVSVWGTVAERQDSGTTHGNDCRLVVSDHPVVTGTTAAPPVYTATASGSATNAPAGSAVFVRMREVPPPTDFGRLHGARTEVWTEHVAPRGRMASGYAEVWTEGPWGDNDPRARVAGIYAEVWSEGPWSGGEEPDPDPEPVDTQQAYPVPTGQIAYPVPDGQTEYPVPEVQQDFPT